MAILRIEHRTFLQLRKVPGGGTNRHLNAGTYTAQKHIYSILTHCNDDHTKNKLHYSDGHCIMLKGGYWAIENFLTMYCVVTLHYIQ